MTEGDATHICTEIEPHEDSLLNLARAVWQLRLLIVGCLIAGAILGAYLESARPRFRTTTTLRWVSPNISYLYSGYWSIAGKIRLSQLTAIAGSRLDAANLFVRAEKDPWSVRLDVVHDAPGMGRQITDEIVRQLRLLDSQPPASTGIAAATNTPLLRLRESLEQLEKVLATIASGTQTTDQTPLDDPIHRINQQFTTEAGPRIPLENLPLFPWYRSLQQRTSRVLASSASSTIAPEKLETLTQLQQQSVERLLQYWWSLDLLVSAGKLPDCVLEPASERAEATPARMLQSIAIWMWISGLTSVLFAIPLRWIRLNWAKIRQQGS
jgi:hypothetical protein